MGLNTYTIFLKNNGKAYGCGTNSSGELGIDKTNSISSITQVNTDNITHIACGNKYTLFVKNDGTVWGCGTNMYGQLGLKSALPVSSISKSEIDNVKSVACGYRHTIFLKQDGTAYGCGYNDNGNLGLGHSIHPILITSKVTTDNIKAVFCGYDYTIFLKNDGSVWGCGSNSSSQLGLGIFPTSTSSPKQLGIEDVKAVACGSSYTIFVKNDGTVWGCGSNNQNQLGRDDSRVNSITKLDIEDVKHVECGNSHTIFLKNDGTVWGCGYNSDGELGLGNTNSSIKTITKLDIEDVESIECGNAHTFFIKKDGSIYCCGNNSSGELGLNHTNSPITTITKAEIEDIKLICNFSILSNKIYLLKEYGIYKTITNGVIESLGTQLPSLDTIKSKGIDDLNRLLIENENVRLIDSLSNKFDVLSYVDKEESTKIQLEVLPKPQIIKAKGDIALNLFDSINKVEVLTLGSGGTIKLAASFDKGVTWKTYFNDTLVEMALDEATFKEKGITLEQLPLISNTLWSEGIKTKTIRFAYCIEYKSVKDNISTDKLEITGDMRGTWKKARHGIDYDYDYPENAILSVKIIEDGSYKINYGGNYFSDDVTILKRY